MEKPTVADQMSLNKLYVMGMKKYIPFRLKLNTAIILA